MRELVVISGKGGTGKTTVTAALAHLASLEGGLMLCDLDVDAPDMHLLLAPKRLETHEFRSGYAAAVDPEACTGCGLCAELCRFGAMHEAEDGKFSIDETRCEGCLVCREFCPAGAVTYHEKLCGSWYASETRLGTLIHALLLPGEENSGRLVAILKAQARERAEARNLPLILCDGAPGIGCPVISSLSGANSVLIVTEPTPSGLHDLRRVAGLCRHFSIPAGVVINKYDLSPENTEEIRRSCGEMGLPVHGLLPHDPVVVQAMQAGKCVTELPATPFSEAVRGVWARVRDLPAPQPA